MKATKSETLGLLISTRDKTLAFFDLAPDKLDRNYGHGKWTIRQILHHLTDAELIFLQRHKKVIAEPKQVAWACDQDLWNDVFDYRHQPLTNKKQLYELCRGLNYDLTDRFFEICGDKEFVHNEAGLKILGEEFRRVALHNDNHIQQIEMALVR